MWNESRVLSWPLMFKRQYAQPLDIDSVFETLAGMDAYLSNTLRHVGQIATCQETEGIIYIMNNNRDAWVTVDTGSGSLIFATTTDLNTYLTNDDRKAGSIATCLETEGILYILNNLRDTWITIDIYSKLDSTEFYTHTGDTSIHYTKDTINITDINSAHTHSISEVSDLQTDLNSKLNLTGGTLSGTLEALTIIANDYSGVTTSMVYNTSTLSGETIEEILEDSDCIYIDYNIIPKSNLLTEYSEHLALERDRVLENDFFWMGKCVKLSESNQRDYGIMYALLSNNKSIIPTFPCNFKNKTEHFFADFDELNNFGIAVTMFVNEQLGIYREEIFKIKDMSNTEIYEYLKLNNI